MALGSAEDVALTRGDRADEPTNSARRGTAATADRHRAGTPPAKRLSSTNCDLSGCTQPDRSCVERSRLRVRWPMRIPLPAQSARVQFSRSDRPVATGADAPEVPGGTRLVANLPTEGAGKRRESGPSARRVIGGIRGGGARWTWGGVDAFAIRRAVRDTNGGSPTRSRAERDRTTRDNRGR